MTILCIILVTIMYVPGCKSITGTFALKASQVLDWLHFWGKITGWLQAEIGAQLCQGRPIKSNNSLFTFILEEMTPVKQSSNQVTKN